MDQETAEALAAIYGSTIAHRLLIQYLFAKVAQTAPDPVAFVKDILGTTLASMDGMTQGQEPDFRPLLKLAATELELIGKNLELRLSSAENK